MADKDLGFNITALDNASKTFVKLASQIDRMAARLDKLDAKDVSVDVNVNTKGATAHLKEFEAGLDRIGGKSVRVAASVGKLSAATFALGSAVPVVANLGLAMGTLAKGAMLLPGALSIGAASAATLATGISGVSDAFKAEAKASNTAGKSAAAQATANAQLDAALSKLAPSARNFVTQIHGMRDGLHSLKLDVQQQLFRGLGDAVSNLATKYLPVLDSGMSYLGTAFNSAAKHAAAFFQESQTVTDIDNLFADAAATVGNLGQALQPVLDGLRDIGSVGAHYLTIVSNQAGGLAQKFADWAHQARESGKLMADFKAFGHVLSNLGHIVVNVGSIIGSVFKAASQNGMGLLQRLRDLTGQMATFMSSAQGRSGLQQFFGTLRQVVDNLRPGVEAIMHALWQAFQDLAPVLPDIARSIGNIASSLAPIIPMFARLARDILPPLLNALESMGPLLPGIVAGFLALRGAFKGLVGITGLVTKFKGIKGALQTLGASKAAKGLGGLGKAAFGLTGILGTLAGGGLVAAATAAAGAVAVLGVKLYDSVTAHQANVKSIVQSKMGYQQAAQALRQNYTAAQNQATQATKRSSTVVGAAGDGAALAATVYQTSAVKTKQATDTVFNAVGRVAAALGVNLPQAYVAAKRAGIDLTAGFKGNSQAAQDNRNKLAQLATQMRLEHDPAFRIQSDWQIINDKSATMKARLNGVRDAFALLNGTLNNDQARINFLNQVHQMNQSLKDNGLTFDMSTQAGRTNRQMLIQSALTAEQNYQARIKQGQGVDVATQALKRDKLEMYLSMVQAGMTRQAAWDLTNQYYKIPGQVKTPVSAPGIDDTTRKVHDLDGAVQSMQDKHIDITAKGIWSSAIAAGGGIATGPHGEMHGGGWGHATGGPIFGPGTGTSDSIPAIGPRNTLHRLSNNEHVWTAREVSAAGGHAAVESMRRNVLRNGSAFARGGPVVRPITTQGTSPGVPGVSPRMHGWLDASITTWAQRIGAQMRKLLAGGGPAKAIAKALMPAYGFGPGQWPALDALWTRESNWQTTIANSSSGAYGIPQALPASKMASAGPDWRTNPATQIRWGLGYIARRYGSPAGALAHENAFNWYGKGLSGAVFDKPTLIGVGESGPERVDVTPLRGSSSSGEGVTINVYPREGMSESAVAAEVERRLTLAMG